jgi:adenylosuccinate synthase
MAVTAIVGANWGDEGKGRMVDALAAEQDIVVRYQGGGNAGHTVITPQGKFVLHLLPSGVLRPDKINVIGPGVALDVEQLERELAGLAERGVPAPRLFVSDRAQLVLEHHRLLDVYEEERLGRRGFGSTRKGIAPFYADKCSKIGIGVDELYGGAANLRMRVEQTLAAKNVLFTQLYGKPAIAPTEVMETLARLREVLRPYVTDTSELFAQALAEGRNILLEGQLGALRDPDHGIYPWVTSSSTLAGYASVGAGLPAASIDRVIAVSKAYSSAVGAGPFLTELAGDPAEELRRRGGDAGEYGATTGRPRRVGWFDAVATRYGCQRQGATELALTCLDVLGYLDQIAICTGYTLDGQLLPGFPTTRKLAGAEPQYEWLPGWGTRIDGAQSFDDLPEAARAYVARIEQLVGVPVRWVSIGPRREQLLERTPNELRPPARPLRAVGE